MSVESLSWTDPNTAILPKDIKAVSIIPTSANISSSLSEILLSLKGLCVLASSNSRFSASCNNWAFLSFS